MNKIIKDALNKRNNVFANIRYSLTDDKTNEKINIWRINVSCLLLECFNELNSNFKYIKPEHIMMHFLNKMRELEKSEDLTKSKKNISKVYDCIHYNIDFQRKKAVIKLNLELDEK